MLCPQIAKARSVAQRKQIESVTSLLLWESFRVWARSAFTIASHLIRPD